MGRHPFCSVCVTRSVVPQPMVWNLMLPAATWNGRLNPRLRGRAKLDTACSTLLTGQGRTGTTALRGSSWVLRVPVLKTSVPFPLYQQQMSPTTNIAYSNHTSQLSPISRTPQRKPKCSFLLDRRPLTPLKRLHKLNLYQNRVTYTFFIFKPVYKEKNSFPRWYPHQQRTRGEKKR